MIMAMVATFSGPVFQFVIIGVSVMRVLALSRWLRAQGA